MTDINTNISPDYHRWARRYFGHQLLHVAWWMMRSHLQRCKTLVCLKHSQTANRISAIRGCHNVKVESIGIIQWCRHWYVCWQNEVRGIRQRFHCHIVWTDQNSHCIDPKPHHQWLNVWAYLGWGSNGTGKEIIYIVAEFDRTFETNAYMEDGDLSFKLGNIADYTYKVGSVCCATCLKNRICAGYAPDAMRQAMLIRSSLVGLSANCTFQHSKQLWNARQPMLLFNSIQMPWDIRHELVPMNATSGQVKVWHVDAIRQFWQIFWSGGPASSWPVKQFSNTEASKHVWVNLLSTLTMKAIRKLSNLKTLDLSSCNKLTCKGATRIGKTCKRLSLLSFSRCVDCISNAILEVIVNNLNIHPLQTYHFPQK